MTNDDDVDDMLSMMDGLCMEDVDTHLYSWTNDTDPADDLAYYFITAYEKHKKMSKNNTAADEEEDILFLNNWETRQVDQFVDVDRVIKKNPLGMVVIDPNPPSLLQPYLIPVEQQPLVKQKVLKQPPPLLSTAHASSSSSSKPQSTKIINKQAKAGRYLQPKNPNL
ncbi:unnamed protein product [Absidia cylindrospora]